MQSEPTETIKLFAWHEKKPKVLDRKQLNCFSYDNKPMGNTEEPVYIFCGHYLGQRLLPVIERWPDYT